jgi:hypothetical protein
MSEHEAIDRGPAFEALKEELAELIEKARIDGDKPDMQMLHDFLSYSVDHYGWRSPLYTHPPVLCEIAEPLARVVEFLKRKDNEAELASRLFWTRLPALVADLESLERAASRPPKRGRRPKYDLIFLVRGLAEKWVYLTDTPFTQLWDRSIDEPISLGAQFVAAVVRYVHPESLPALPKMLEQVVKEIHSR